MVSEKAAPGKKNETQAHGGSPESQSGFSNHGQYYSADGVFSRVSEHSNLLVSVDPVVVHPR